MKTVKHLLTSATISVTYLVLKKIKLEIWGKAQPESARHPKSDWGENSTGGEIPQ